MDIQEMHNSVMQGVDKIDAQVADTLLAIEIDRELNKSIQQFASTRFQQNNKYGQGFEESQKRRDDLRTLVREVESPVVFKEQLRDATHSDGALFVDTWTMPNEYMHLINLNVIVNRLEDCSEINYQLQDQDEMYYFVLDFKDFIANGGTTYIDELWMVTDIEQEWGSINWEGQMLWSNGNFEDVAYPNNKQEVIDSFTIASIDPLVPMFWETWENPNLSSNSGVGNLYLYNFPDSIILAINFDSTSALLDEMNADASLGPVTYAVGRYQNESVVFSAIRFNNDTSHRRVPSLTNFVRENYPCRLVQHDDIYKLVSDPFNKTKYSSPLTIMRGNQIDIYSDNIFLSDQIRLTYLKLPELVSLVQGVNCELPENTHEEIIRLAVASILEQISDPRYQTHLMQVDKME